MNRTKVGARPGSSGEDGHAGLAPPAPAGDTSRPRGSFTGTFGRSTAWAAGRSAARLARLLREQEVPGSNPGAPMCEEVPEKCGTFAVPHFFVVASPEVNLAQFRHGATAILAGTPRARPRGGVRHLGRGRH